MSQAIDKALSLGSLHKRVPDTISSDPVITGHEFAGVIEEVGGELADGDATWCIVPAIAIEKGCALPYDDGYYANGSLAEPMSCIIGAFRSSYHTEPLVWEHHMGLKPGGRLALLGSGGAMGVGALDYALDGPFTPSLVVAVDVDAQRLERLRALFPPEEARRRGCRLEIVDAAGQDLVEALRAISADGFDDVVVFAAIEQLIEAGDAVLARDGCLNFFAGPTSRSSAASLNLYNIHYESTHLVGTSGGSRSDMDLTAIADFEARAQTDPRFARLAEVCAEHGNIWNHDAEDHVLQAFAPEVRA